MAHQRPQYYRANTISEHTNPRVGQAQEAPALGTKLQQSIGTTAETVHVFKDLMREVTVTNITTDRPDRRRLTTTTTSS